MRQVLDAAVVEVIAQGRAVLSRAEEVTGEGADLRRPGGVDLLVGEAHPHRRVGLDEPGVRQLVLLGHRAGQTDLGEHVPAGGDREQPGEGRRWCRHGRASVPLPSNQASTSWITAARKSLRKVNSRSFSSIRTGTGNRLLVTPGLSGWTSVGAGTASSSTDRVGSASSRGRCAPTRSPVRPPGSRRK